jgi:molecular chaperone GrpE (heat shock protein)
MSDQKVGRLAKWPFVFADVFLLSVAYGIYRQSPTPMGAWPMAVAALCVIFAALAAMAPFVLEQRAAVRMAEVASLTEVMEEMKTVHELSAQIANATSLWQSVQEHADRTVSSVKEITSKASGEAQALAQTMQRLNDGEKATMRVEVDKLRRAESEWLQVLVRVMDHVFAVHQAAMRSGKPGLIEQMDLFQSACRDAARRVGLAPFSAEPGEVFDNGRHQWMDPKTNGKPGSAVGETVAAGYTFRGQIIRPALVSPLTGGEPAPAGPDQDTLVLEGNS